MELKHFGLDEDGYPIMVLIVPSGIETTNHRGLMTGEGYVLIVPSGIETSSKKLGLSQYQVLIVPSGIETQ